MALLLSPAAKQKNAAKDDAPFKSLSRSALSDMTNSSPSSPEDSNNRGICRSDSEAIDSLLLLAEDKPRDRDQGRFDDDNSPPPMLPPSEYYLQDNNGRDNNHDTCSSNQSNNNTDEEDAIEEELEGASDNNNADEEDAIEEDIEAALGNKPSASLTLSRRVSRCIMKSITYESNAGGGAGACGGGAAGATGGGAGAGAADTDAVMTRKDVARHAGEGHHSRTITKEDLLDS